MSGYKEGPSPMPKLQTSNFIKTKICCRIQLIHKICESFWPQKFCIMWCKVKISHTKYFSYKLIIQQSLINHPWNIHGIIFMDTKVQSFDFLEMIMHFMLVYVYSYLKTRQCKYVILGVGGIDKYHTTVFKIKYCGITKYLLNMFMVTI